MKPSELKSTLVHAFKNGLKVLVKGAPGLGKSDLIDSAAAEAECDCITRHPSVEEPTDAKGMPIYDAGDKEAHFTPFGDLVKLINATQPTVVHLEDLGQATHAVQAAYMQLLLRRSINGTRISDQVIFCASTNDTSHRAGVNSLLEPVKSRFDTILELEADLDDWCLWAYQANLPAEVIAFIRFRPALLSAFEATRELTNSPSPRTVAAVAKWVAAGVTNFEVLAGAAGKGFAAEFVGFLKVYQQLPSIDEIMLNPQKAPVPENPSALYAIVAALVKRFNKTAARACFTYAGRLPKEFEVCLVRDAQRVNTDLRTTREFTEWSIKNASVLVA